MSAPTIQQLSNLGTPVTTSIVSWHDLCVRAWGSEWNAPDHDIYKMSNGRGFDSTDQTSNGFYTKFVEPSTFTLDVSHLDSTSLLG
jgi:hypothetical protein